MQLEMDHCCHMEQRQEQLYYQATKIYIYYYFKSNKNENYIPQD